MCVQVYMPPPWCGLLFCIYVPQQWKGHIYRKKSYIISLLCLNEICESHTSGMNLIYNHMLLRNAGNWKIWEGSQIYVISILFPPYLLTLGLLRCEYDNPINLFSLKILLTYNLLHSSLSACLSFGFIFYIQFSLSSFQNEYV